MATVADVKLVIKHTFLEYVVDESATTRARGLSDSMFFSKSSSSRASEATSVPSSPAPSVASDKAISPRVAWCDVKDDEDECLPQSSHDDHVPQPYVPEPCGAQMEPWASQAYMGGYMWMHPAAPQMQYYMGNDSRPQHSWSSTAGSNAVKHRSSMSSSSSFVTQPEPKTTVMLKNLPTNMTLEILTGLLDAQGFACKFDFVYLPRDFGSGRTLGYALVNLTTSAHVDDFWACFEGFTSWPTPSNDVCTITWSEPHQGLDVHIERYRNSPVMHSSVCEGWKPALFVNGRKVSFPAPTKKLKAPKFKPQRNA